MVTNKIQFYTVEGYGRFPLDMLRYDMAWPDSPQDTSIIEDHLASGLRRVNLRRVCHFHPTPSEARWRSFGWWIVTGSIRKESG